MLYGAVKCLQFCNRAFFAYEELAYYRFKHAEFFCGKCFYTICFLLPQQQNVMERHFEEMSLHFFCAIFTELIQLLTMYSCNMFSYEINLLYFELIYLSSFKQNQLYILQFNII